ncbi:MAG: hypothetical protein E6G06_14495 [Actinobacteria bacterium]|jgi:hypothetical protein|nr:MAG: hypothetical protein E6G06_14495 [Actinomycetota bacterium]
MTTTSDRMDQFKSDVSDMKLKTGTASRDTVLQVSGALLMVGAVAVALITYSASLNQSDTRDVLSSGILAVAMLGVAVLGAAIFLRYSMAKFLRLWLLRQLYEGQANAGRVVDAITRGD